jgi:hypothetical protein
MLENNNHNNSTCAFVEQTVSYLYRETDAQEKTVFEAHLKSCRSCADEFAGFSAVHSSVIEWRNEEFLSLETPLIEISYENTRKFYNLENEPTVPRSWFVGLRKLFTFSPALTASASLALILFCIGIVFFAYKSSSNNKTVADNNSKSVEKEFASTPTAKEIVPNEETIASAVDNESSRRQTTSKPKVFRKNSTVKISADSRNSAKNSNRTGNVRIIKAANNENKPATFAQAGKVPRLNNVEEVEDKSLRLAELLDDGDSE